MGKEGGVKPNLARYFSCTDRGASPSSSSGSKLNTAIVPSEDTAYSVNPSRDLRQNETIIKRRSQNNYQDRSIICRSNTSFATTMGRADLVCHTETERSSAPNATTEQMFDATTG